MHFPHGFAGRCAARPRTGLGRSSYGLQRISENQIISNTWTPSFYQYDGGGSTRLLTNAAGAVTDSYDYDAFGNKINSTGTTPNNFLYRGEQFDSDLGLYYLRARYYNPLTGRFMSRDPNDPQPIDSNGAPVDPKSLQKYLYAGGDPINAMDPTGRAELFETGLTLDKIAFDTNIAVAGVGSCIAGILTTVGAELEAGSLKKFFDSPSATGALPFTVLACPLAVIPYL
jgi:RHS repeat-associated protein